jgi:hypothetical protein
MTDTDRQAFEEALTRMDRPAEDEHSMRVARQAASPAFAEAASSAVGTRARILPVHCKQYTIAAVGG